MSMSNTEKAVKDIRRKTRRKFSTEEKIRIVLDGCSFRIFNVLDDYNREEQGIEGDSSLPAGRVIRALDEIIEWRGKPDGIRCDNGPEYISADLAAWSKKHRIKLHFIQPGKPQQNAYIERLHRPVRHERLNQHLFESIEYAQSTATEWLWQYNTNRPNMAIGGITPYQKLAQAA